MKKFLSLTIIAIIALIGLSVSVNAAEVVSDEAGLRTKLEAGNSVELSADIEGITTKSTTTPTPTTKRTVGVAIKGEGTITIDGKGKTVSSDTLDVLFEIYTDSELTVIFKDITIVAKTRAIDIRKPGVSIELDNAKVQVKGSGNTQALTVGGPSGPIDVTITDSTVSADGAGYAIVTFNPVNMTIKNSVIEGYAALYFKGADSSLGSSESKVTVEKSELNGYNNYSGDEDSFGTVIFEDEGVTLEIIDSKINAESTGEASQFALAESAKGTLGGNFTKPTKIDISGETIVNAKNDAIVILPNHSESAKPQITIEPGVKSNKDLTEYLPEGVIAEYDGNGNYIVKVELDKPTNLKWDGTTAKWDAVSNATGYTVMLYNGTEIVEVFSLKDTKLDLSKYLTKEDGKYNFAVFAEGDGKVYLDSQVAASEVYVFPTSEGGQGTAEQEPAKKDETPKTGAFDIALYVLGAIVLVSVVGTVKAKKPGKYSK